MLIGCMAWRIGEVLDLREQLAWLRANGFEAVAFWTCAGQPGVWQGYDLAQAGQGETRDLRAALAGFREVDLHADVPLRDEQTLLRFAQTREQWGGHSCPPQPLAGKNARPTVPASTRDSVRRLRRVLAFAGEIGASTATIHVEAEGAWLQEALGSLDEAAKAAEVRIGLELTGSYELAMQEATPHVGLTLDVGHISFEDGAGYREFGSIGGLIRHVGNRLVHVHAHDYDGVLDHLPVGAGKLDWDDIAEGLRSVGYEGVVCLELDPDRATPEQLLQSRDRLDELVR